MGQWFDIPIEHRAGRECAGCREEAAAVFEAGGIGSDYCAECAEKVKQVLVEVNTPNEAIDDGAHDTYAGDPE